MNIVTTVAREATVASTDRPTREEAEAAIRTLLRWAGDDPTREGLVDTPARVARAYEEFFAGYAIDPVALLVYMLMQPLFGALSDRIGRRQSMILFGLFATIGTVPLLHALKDVTSPYMAFVLVVVALVAMLIAAEAGAQAALMRQHDHQAADGRVGHVLDDPITAFEVDEVR